MRWEAEAVGRLLGTRPPSCCAFTAPTSNGAACTLVAWRLCPPSGCATPPLPRALPDGDVELLAVTARMRLRPAA